jgi:hypothetical protein
MVHRREEGAQLLSSAEQMDLHRRGRASEDLGDPGHRCVLEVVQHHHGTLSPRQPPDGLQDLDVDLLDDRRVRRPLGRVAALAVADGPDRQPHGHLADPGTGTVETPDAVPAPDQAEERLLGELLGLREVVADEEDRAQDMRVLRPVQAFEVGIVTRIRDP